MVSMLELREQLLHVPSNRFVTRDEFVSELLSHHSWIRDDEPNANMLGLRDENTGSRLLIAAEVLEQAAPDSASATGSCDN